MSCPLRDAQDIREYIASTYRKMVAIGLTTGAEAVYLPALVREVLFPDETPFVCEGVELDIIVYSPDETPKVIGEYLSVIYIVDKEKVRRSMKEIQQQIDGSKLLWRSLRSLGDSCHRPAEEFGKLSSSLLVFKEALVVCTRRKLMIYLRYLRSLLRHKWFVLRASRRVGVPLCRAIVHDWTKFLPVEFVNYAQWHFGIKSVDGWARAWGHHQNHNPHHPEYHLLSWRGEPGFYRGLGQRVTDFVVVLAMPERFVREMVADFLGSARAYTGSWDIVNWLNENGPKMILHYDTICWINTIMFELGYVLTDNCDWSWAKVGR